MHAARTLVRLTFSCVLACKVEGEAIPQGVLRCAGGDGQASRALEVPLQEEAAAAGGVHPLGRARGRPVAGARSGVHLAVFLSVLNYIVACILRVHISAG